MKKDEDRLGPSQHAQCQCGCVEWASRVVGQGWLAGWADLQAGSSGMAGQVGWQGGLGGWPGV